MIDLHDHTVCERRQAHAWQTAAQEIEKRLSLQRHLNFWRPLGITLLVFDLARVVGWFP